MRNNARTLRRAVRPAAVLCAALALAACSETLGPLQGAPSKVAEVDADNPGANAGNIASLTDVIQRNPSDSVAYNTRGIAYAKAGNYKSAIDDFTKAVQIDPKFNAAYTNRALAFRQMGKDGPALADFNAAIAANPNDASAYLGRGNLLQIAEPPAGGDGRPRRGDPPQPGGRAGLPRARPDLSAPRQQRTGDHRLQQRHRPRPVRRRALSGARPESAGDRQIRSGGRRLQRGAQRRFEQRRSLGRAWGSPTRSSATSRRRSSPTSARRWSRRAIRRPRPGCSGWAQPEAARRGPLRLPICCAGERRRGVDCGDAPFVFSAPSL